MITVFSEDNIHRTVRLLQSFPMCFYRHTSSKVQPHLKNLMIIKGIV